GLVDGIDAFLVVLGGGGEALGHVVALGELGLVLGRVVREQLLLQSRLALLLLGGVLFDPTEAVLVSLGAEAVAVFGQVALHLVQPVVILLGVQLFAVGKDRELELGGVLEEVGVRLGLGRVAVLERLERNGIFLRRLEDGLIDGDFRVLG